MAIPVTFEQVTHNSPDGAQICRTTSDLVSFYGNDPVVQPADANQAEAGAITATNPTTPAALTSVQLAFTWTLGDPAVTDGTATIANGATIGDDNDADNPISAIEDQYNKLQTDVVALRAEVITYETAISALVVDVTAVRLLTNQLRSELVTLGLIAGA